MDLVELDRGRGGTRCWIGARPGAIGGSDGAAGETEEERRASRPTCSSGCPWFWMTRLEREVRRSSSRSERGWREKGKKEQEVGPSVIQAEQETGLGLRSRSASFCAQSLYDFLPSSVRHALKTPADKFLHRDRPRLGGAVSNKSLLAKRSERARTALARDFQMFISCSEGEQGEESGFIERVVDAFGVFSSSLD